MKPLIKIFFVLLIITAFFPLRHVFEVPQNFLTGAYSDFTSFSIYSCDLVIFALLVLLSLSGALRQKPNALLIAWLMWLLGMFFLNIKGETSLNLYFLARIAELIVLHETIRQKGYEYKDLLLKTFIFMGSLQAILAIFQFYSQKSVGLYLLGEQHLDIWALGVAKIGLETGKYLRAYGTFPHSNLLSAFLVTAVLLNLYFLIKSTKRAQRIVISANLGLTIFGLFLTFSRAGLLALGTSLVPFFVIALWKEGATKRLIFSGVIVGLWLATSIVMLKPFLLARTQFLSDQSAKERIFYAELGTEMVKDHPITGVGIGTSVLHMEQYSPTKLETWEIQPIHNYYLLSAAEFGIPGALILLALFLFYLKGLILRIKDNFSFYSLTLLSIFKAFLVLMIFDHYFYTIEQTQILLWLVLGLIAAEISLKQKTSSEEEA